MKPPLKLGRAYADRKNGGEFYVVKDAEGAWIGDIRAEHAPEIVLAMNATRPEEVEHMANSPHAWHRNQVIEECALVCVPDDHGPQGTIYHTRQQLAAAIRALKHSPPQPQPHLPSETK